MGLYGDRGSGKAAYKRVYGRFTVYVRTGRLAGLISDLVAGKWQGGQQYVNLKSGSISLAISPVIRDNLPESKLDAWDAAMAAVEDAKTKIINGELVIEMNTTWNR